MRFFYAIEYDTINYLMDKDFKDLAHNPFEQIELIYNTGFAIVKKNRGQHQYTWKTSLPLPIHSPIY